MEHKNWTRGDTCYIIHDDEVRKATVCWSNYDMYNLAAPMNMGVTIDESNESIRIKESDAFCDIDDAKIVLYTKRDVASLAQFARNHAVDRNNHDHTAHSPMNEKRCIEAEDLKLCYTGTNGYDDKASYASIRKMIDSRPTIDPETLPIVQELRAKLASYESAETDGRWVKLPCKINDDIWWVDEDNECVKCDKHGVKGIAVFGDHFEIIGKGGACDKIGTNGALLSKEDADSALAKIKHRNT